MTDQKTESAADIYAGLGADEPQRCNTCGTAIALGSDVQHITVRGKFGRLRAAFFVCAECVKARKPVILTPG